MTVEKVTGIQTITFIILLLFCAQAKAQYFLSTDGKAIVTEDQDTILFRGMGLGGWMVQEGYMLQTAGFASPQHKIKALFEELIGESNTEEFYDAWLSNHVRKSDIDSLKSWGFNMVRLPMHYNLFTLPIEEEPLPGSQTWLDKGFILTDSLISWCRQNEMYVILDLHAAPGGQGYDAGISDYDDTKPSLWESKANRDKTVALWKKLAERYADEPWVAGYDLLNEPNWDLPGNTALRALYKEITDSIRTVDDRHLLFIEGNWFANDFTGLTPPWDANMVYSPHKYWSDNDVAAMQWVIDIQNTFNVPLFLGESGENSNRWFRDAIRLLEDLKIGWAWWPLKKVESISCPLSVTKTPEYQMLLDYWNGNGPKPGVSFAKAALIGLAEGLKTENCRYQQDVIDAMFRQVYSDETIPYKGVHPIPGVIPATDYDMGVIGEAYYDQVNATYQVSSGIFTAWNSGWAYRNDGVDIEPCTDPVNGNGFNLGFLDEGEWTQYEVKVAESGVYNIEVRASSGGSGGRLHFSAGGASISPSSFAPPTGGWQNWETLTIPQVILDSSDRKIRLHIDAAGFNISSFKFVKTGLSPAEVPMKFMAAVTLDEYTIKMNANKFVADPLPNTPEEFEIFVDGVSVPINSITPDPENKRNIIFTVDHLLKSTDEIRMSYNGNSISALDGTELAGFVLEEVENTLFFVHQLPGRIEAEAYAIQSGVSLEETTDNGGGQNIAYLDPGDYLEYEVNILEATDYKMEFRTAALFGTGALQVQLVDDSENVSIISSISFASTGGWQNWITSGKTVSLPKGRYRMRLLVTAAPFNLNWIEVKSTVTAVADPVFEAATLSVFPNPSMGSFNLFFKTEKQQPIQLEIYNQNGQLLVFEEVKDAQEVHKQLLLEGQPAGKYFLVLKLEDGSILSRKLLKVMP